jgi:hypothetical protein
MSDDETRAGDALERVRADLRRASGKRRLDVILSQREPAALVRALPADELYLTIREIGLGDAVELVQLATPAQFRTFLDLACWSGDHLAPRKALPWLRAARAGATESPRASSRWRAKLHGIDAEVLYLVLRETLTIHDLERDPDPHLTTERFMRTPEGKYVVEFHAEGTEYMAVRGILDDLYAEDPFRATRLLSSIRWDLPSELEEAALRWRTGRLADLGYPSLEEALSWFARPAARTSGPAGTPARGPGFYLERIGTGSLLARAAARLTPAERDHLELELVTAANAILVADAVDPGDPDAVRAAVAGGRAFVEMGLEPEAGADEARAAEVLATTAVKALFQRGFGRVLELKWRAERLLSSGRAGTRDRPWLDAPLGEAVAALARRRPLYYPGLELPRDEWGSIAAAASTPRGFLSSAEVARTQEALALAEEVADVAAALGLAPGGGGTMGAAYLTALANERLGRSFSAEPLPRDEVAAAAAVLQDVDEARLRPHGRAGALLAGLARRRAEELAPIRDGGIVRPEHVSALLVR